MAEPPVTIRATFSSFTAGDNTNPTRYVIHATCGGQGYPAESAAGVALATAKYFASGHAGGSAHYIHDVASEQHCVPEDTVAYHAPPNAHSIGDEICADGGTADAKNYTRAQWLSPQVWPAVVRAAARCREVCLRKGIPLVKLSSADLLAGKHGICGHSDVSQAWHQSDHSDPGPGFPWPEFMALVNPPTPAPAPAPATPPGDDMTAQFQADVRADLAHKQAQLDQLVAGMAAVVAQLTDPANHSLNADLRATLAGMNTRDSSFQADVRADLAHKQAQLDQLAPPAAPPAPPAPPAPAAGK